MTAKSSTPPALPLTVAGGDYVVIPRSEYLRLTGGQAPELALAAAKAAVLAEMGKRVRAARKHAGLTQADLAARMGCTQAMVCRAEKGKVVSDGFLERVHEACGLPEGWLPPVPPVTPDLGTRGPA